MGEMKYMKPSTCIEGELSCILIHDEIDKFEHIILGMVVRETRDV